VLDVLVADAERIDQRRLGFDVEQRNDNAQDNQDRGSERDDGGSADHHDPDRPGCERSIEGQRLR
jgi:hypothetical protein